MLDGPALKKRAPRVGPISIVIVERERIITDWKQCHGSHGFHTGACSGDTTPRRMTGMILHNPM